MRIRKNSKLSSVLLATTGYGGDRPETYMCHFNQSPWDVIPVTSFGDGDGTAELTNLLDSSWFLPSPLPSPATPHIHQFDGEDDGFNRKVSLGNSNGVAPRLKSYVVSVERLNLVTAEDYERSPDVDEPMDQSGNSEKNSKSKSAEPNSPVKTSGDEEQVAVSVPAPPKRGRPRGTGKKAPVFTATSTNPYEFYYYSGFGPRWGKKRGGTGDGDGENMVTDENVGKKSSGSEEGDGKTASFGEGSSSVSVDGFDYVEEDNNDQFMEEDQESDHGRKKKKKMMMMKKTKKGRKPVKERSLKSLM